MNLPLLPQDKANHFIYGHLIACVVVAWLGVLKLPQAAPLSALIAAAFFGAVKEAHDAYVNRTASGSCGLGPHGVEWWDFLATTAGAVPMAILLWALLP